MKYLEYLIWVFGIIAGILILLATIAFLFGVKFFGINHVVNYFHVANSFLLLCLCCAAFLILKKKDT